MKGLQQCKPFFVFWESLSESRVASVIGPALSSNYDADARPSQFVLFSFGNVAVNGEVRWKQ